jgi:hypothetical protein
MTGSRTRANILWCSCSVSLLPQTYRPTGVPDAGVQCWAKVVPSSPILVTLMMEALRSSEASALTRATRRNIPEDDILHSHRRENLKSYIALTGWTV